MTEAAWLACTDPREMLECLDGRASERRLRLFTAARCRRIRGLLTEEPGRQATEVAEGYADGKADDEAPGGAEDVYRRTRAGRLLGPRHLWALPVGRGARAGLRGKG